MSPHQRTTALSIVTKPTPRSVPMTMSAANSSACVGVVDAVDGHRPARALHPHDHMQLFVLGIHRIRFDDFSPTHASDLADQLVSVPRRLPLDLRRFVLDLL